MEIEIISFGKIAEFLQNQELQLEGIVDTEQLREHLENKFPRLSSMKYKLAVNKKLVQVNTLINNNDSVAIMPPFSGG
ncbi:MoaD/ThiS family protein [Pedobacter cryotolerans]|uniref:MoaD/ThiS family protein n=1 Tax=Pedobacter cryotolerans TaxID=2571270 RepID=A0A4U1C7N7_9SPHI|nr:MoaD/ThiS family protein [Pedobacter cryotolerans]TKC01555.1 MoaD/ThiS family protein [Pedobacter cryotolerans]